jgi:hypothetical protein
LTQFPPNKILLREHYKHTYGIGATYLVNKLNERYILYSIHIVWGWKYDVDDDDWVRIPIVE